MRLVADVRLTLMLVVALMTATDPTWALRQGVVLAGIAILLALGQKILKRVDVVAVLFAAWAYASTSWAIAPEISSLGAQNTAACVVLFVAVRATVREAKQLRWMASAFVLGCWFGLFLLIDEGANLRWSYDASAARVGIEGLNYNALSYALVVGAALAALLWAVKARPRSPKTHTALLGSWVLTYAGVILSGTRGALLALLVLAAWFCVGRRLGPTALVVAIVGVVATHVVLALGLLDGELRGFLALDAARDAGDLSGRLGVWPAARQAVWERPIQGLGVDGVQAHPDNLLDVAAHNMVLDVASGLGLVGLALFVYVVVGAIREALKLSSEVSRLVVGGYVLAIFPITLSGFWTEAAAFWLSLALISRLPVCLAAEEPTERDVVGPHAARFVLR